MLGLVLFLAGVSSYCFFFNKYSIYGNELEKIRINDKEFKVEVVNNERRRVKGLGERNGICEYCGMFFEFPKKDFQAFWMRGMRFDLDIIWIDGKKIVYIEKNISYNHTKTMNPGILADKVLEIKAGMSDKYSLEIGDEVYLEK
jgi:uncharacterized protein